MNESIRAVMLTEAGQVLLMKIAGRRGDIWITPGGRAKSGEPPLATLAREIEEETGLREIRAGPEFWIRHATFESDRGIEEERERFFLVSAEAFEPDVSRMEPAERSVFREFRWWPIEEVARSGERFAPRRLGELLLTLRRDGPPPTPVETGE